MNSRNVWLWVVLAAIGGLVLWKRKEIAGGAASAATAITTEAKQVGQAFINLKNAITSKFGLERVKEREGWRERAYKDIFGYWTIGFGHLVQPNEMALYVGTPITIKGEPRGGIIITKEQGEAILRKDIAWAEKLVRDYVKVPLTQEQFDGLASFAFNVGPGRKGVKDGFIVLKNGNTPTFLKKLNAGDYKGAAASMKQWTNGGVPGLVARRAEETGPLVV